MRDTIVKECGCKFEIFASIIGIELNNGSLEVFFN